MSNKTGSKILLFVNITNTYFCIIPFFGYIYCDKATSGLTNPWNRLSSHVYFILYSSHSGIFLKVAIHCKTKVTPTDLPTSLHFLLLFCISVIIHFWRDKENAAAAISIFLRGMNSLHNTLVFISAFQRTFSIWNSNNILGAGCFLSTIGRTSSSRLRR